MSMKNFLKRKYNDYADKYYGTWIYWNSSANSKKLRTLFEELFEIYINKEKKVLDLGAGRLPYRSIIKKHTESYFSIDFKKTHPDLDYIGTTSDTKLEDETFNVVFCNQVLEHVPDPKESFSEIYRILKPRGIAIISTPFLVELHNEPYDYFRYTKYALKLFAEESNFKILELEESGGIFSIIGRQVSKVFILLFYWIPVLKYLFIFLNLTLQRVLLFFDKILGVKELFPCEYVLVLEKTK
jgi:SAM-dependent methyltransferase